MRPTLAWMTYVSGAMLGPIFGACMAANAQSLEISASKELVWDQTEGIYEAIGQAEATRGAQSISAETLTAFYDASADSQDIERITAITDVRFSDETMSGQGARLDYNIAKDHYELAGPDARVISQDGNISADDLISYNRKDGLVIAKGNGFISLADGRILQGDLLEITLTSTDEIQTVIATGNVYAKQENGREARAKTGTYDAQSGKALLTGDVKIIDGDSVLNGQRAEIDFNNGISRLLAEEGKGRVSGTLADDS